MSDRRNTAKWARSSSTSSDWLSAMRVPRRESAVELSYAVHRIENLQRQMPMLGLALFCFGLFLAFQNWPFTHFTSLTWIAANLLASVVVFWAGTSLTKWLYANPVRAVKLIGSGAAIIGLMLGSTAGLLDSSPGIAAIVTGAIIGMMIFAALPLAQLVFLIGFLLGELLFGGLQLPALMISGAGALICTGTWLSAHFSIHRIEGELALQEEKLERFAGQNDSIRWSADTDGMLAQTSLAAFKSHGLMAENTMSFSISVLRRAERAKSARSCRPKMRFASRRSSIVWLPSAPLPTFPSVCPVATGFTG